MVATGTVKPLVCIVGVTGSGKSALAMRLAERFDGELICADSRTVYRGMDIGTAKPTAEDRARIPHHGLDLVRPDETFSAADFQAYARDKIDAVSDAGRLPILVGGTGLYVDAILYDYSFRSPATPEVRAKFAGMTVEEMQRSIRDAGYRMPQNVRNPRHLQRVLETAGQEASATRFREHTVVIGLDPGREILQDRLIRRVEHMVQAGLIHEIEVLQNEYGWEVPSMQSTGYRAFRGFMQGSETLDQAMSGFVRNDMRLSKRQRTWFRRNKSIHWQKTDETYDKSVELITTLLNT